MKRYRTQIVIPGDRVIVLHLPAHLAEGLATVTVQVDEPDDPHHPDHDHDHHDIEWWDEFDDDEPARLE